MKAKTFRDLLKYYKENDVDLNEFIHTHFPKGTYIETGIYVADAEELDKLHEI